MSSQAQKNQEKWREYCANLNRGGNRLSEAQQREHNRQANSWNTVDVEAARDLERIIGR